MTKSRVMVWLLIALGVVSGVVAAIMLVGAQIGVSLAALSVLILASPRSSSRPRKSRGRLFL